MVAFSSICNDAKSVWRTFQGAKASHRSLHITDSHMTRSNGQKVLLRFTSPRQFCFQYPFRSSRGSVGYQNHKSFRFFVFCNYSYISKGITLIVNPVRKALAFVGVSSVWSLGWMIEALSLSSIPCSSCAASKVMVKVVIHLKTWTVTCKSQVVFQIYSQTASYRLEIALYLFMSCRLFENTLW